MGLGLVLIVWVVAVQAALPEEDFFVPKLNLLTIHPSVAHAGNDTLPPFQISASVVLTRSPDSAPFGAGVSSNSPFLSITKPQQESIQALNLILNQTYEGDRVSLPRNLRIEFKVEQLNIAVRPNTVSIDEERFKVVLHSHAASMLWRKPF
jgi:hypothetical protein